MHFLPKTDKRLYHYSLRYFQGRGTNWNLNLYHMHTSRSTLEYSLILSTATIRASNSLDIRTDQFRLCVTCFRYNHYNYLVTIGNVHDTNKVPRMNLKFRLSLPEISTTWGVAFSKLMGTQIMNITCTIWLGGA